MSDVIFRRFIPIGTTEDMDKFTALLVEKNITRDDLLVRRWTKMANRMGKWLHHTFSFGCETGSDYDAFQREARAVLRKQAKAAGFALHRFIPGHYEFSAVLRDETTGEFVYVAISDVRFCSSEWYHHVLYRTMAHDKDWTGGYNCWCSWPELGEALSKMRMRRCG